MILIIIQRCRLAVAQDFAGRKTRKYWFGRKACGKVLHHVGLGIHAVDPAFGHHVREARREVAGAGADVSDDRVGFERQRLNHFMRLLPCVALRIVKYLRPFLRAAEAVFVGVGGLRHCESCR